MNSNAEEPPVTASLETNLGPIHLRHPIINASGTRSEERRGGEECR